MGRHRNRLLKYKTDAAAGKLEKLSNNPEERAQQIANLTGQPVHVVTEQLINANDANIRKDSAQMEKDIASLLAAVFANDADGFLEPPDGMSACFIIFSDGLGRFRPRTEKWLIDQMSKKGKENFMEMISVETDKNIKRWKEMFDDTDTVR